MHMQHHFLYSTSYVVIAESAGKTLIRNVYIHQPKHHKYHQFLYENTSQSDNQLPTVVLLSHSQPNQEMASEPSRSETNLLDSDNNMEVEPLNDSVTHINLSGILNKTIQPDIQRDTPVDEEMTQSTTKASHHKAFMETCLMRNSLPRNMSLWVQPHIYHSNAEIEKQWKDTLHQASLSLTSTLIQHYMRVIKSEQGTLEKIKKEIKEYLQTHTERTK